MDKVKIQDEYVAKLSETDLVVLDKQTDFSPTKPLLHTESRFLYVISGSAKIKIQNKVYDMHEGVIIALNPWQISEIIQVDDHVTYYLLVYKYELFNYQIKTTFNINHEQIPFMDTLYEVTRVVVPHNMRRKILHLMEDIRDEIGICSIDLDIEEKDYRDIYIFSKVSEFLVYFLRLSKNDKKENTNEEYRFVSEEIFRYMFMNVSEELSLSKLSKIFYMSESSISSYIKSITGIGFYELIQNMKLSKVKFLLLHTNMTLEQIGNLLNFPDPAKLSKEFSNHIGHTTHEYKEINKIYPEFFDAHLDRRSGKILEYVYDNYQEDINILQVSQLFDITPRNLNKILKYYVEQNFKNFLSKIRIIKSCELLVSTNYNFIDIAIMVGFNNEKTFTRNFVKQIGMTPKEYRKNLEQTK